MDGGVGKWGWGLGCVSGGGWEVEGCVCVGGWVGQGSGWWGKWGGGGGFVCVCVSGGWAEVEGEVGSVCVLFLLLMACVCV